MHTQFATILLFLIIGALTVPAMLLLGKLLRPQLPSAVKQSTYECGEVPIGDSWIQFNLRFYVIAILFLVFEAEIVLVLPVATMFKHWSASSEISSLLVFIEFAIFIAILLIGFAYAWEKGDLQWIRPEQKNIPDKRKP